MIEKVQYFKEIYFKIFKLFNYKIMLNFLYDFEIFSNFFIFINQSLKKVLFEKYNKFSKKKKIWNIS